MASVTMSLRFVLLCFLVGGSFAHPFKPLIPHPDASDKSDKHILPLPVDPQALIKKVNPQEVAKKVNNDLNVLFPVDPQEFAKKVAHDVNILFPADAQHEFFKKVTSGIDHFLFADFFKNLEWLYRQVEPVVHNVVNSGLVGVESWAVDIVARMEFLTMADGSHFFVPLGGKNNVEQEYKIVSIAVSKLLRNLKSMERTDKLLMNVTRTLVSESVDNHKALSGTKPDRFLKTILSSYIEGLNKKFEHDDVLAAEYKKQKSAAKEYVTRNPTMREPLFNLGQEYKLVSPSEIKAFMEDKYVLREGFVNKMFMKMSVKHFQMIFNATHHTRYLMARALIQTAESSGYESKVNEIYQNALAHARSYIPNEENVVMDELFNYIESGLASNPTLQNEIQTRMNQLETSTTFDFGMFNIDVSVL